jgi:galactose mutarotase-like enzyme
VDSINPLKYPNVALKGCKPTVKYALENDFLKIEINTQGAELLSILGKSDGYQYIWQGDPVLWEYRAPVLFPIVGNLNQERYLYEGKEYSMQRHGFAAKMEFRQFESSENSMTFSLVHEGSTLCQYPFKFQLLVTYTLQDEMLTIAYRVENTDRKTIWFSIGGHPGFNCSLKPEGQKDCRLVFEKNETVSRLVNELGYLTGREELFLNDQNTIDLASVDFDGKTKVSILKGLRSESITLEDKGSGKKVQVRFAGFPYLGVWSPSNRAPFVCIEPWYGITCTAGVEDVLDRKLGIQRLEAGECFACSYDIVCLREN